MKQFNVTGMSCAACSTNVEKAVSKVEGVTACAVSLLTNSMSVEGTADSNSIIKAVEKAGYQASEKKGSSTVKDNREDDFLKDRETPALKRRLIASVIFLVLLMYFSMGHMMWNWPIPRWFNGNHVAMGLLQLILTAIIMVINQRFFINGFKGLVHGTPNMDTLVALGSMASFVWSTYALFMMTDAQVHGNDELVMKYMNEFYFESAAMILTLITVGKMLEARSKGKTTDALKGLIELSPKTAVLLRDNVETTVSIEQVKIGDIFVVRPGENIPVDAIIIEGETAINESALTGESIPVDKQKGDTVSAATINQSGFIKCEATRVGEDTTLSQIIKMVSDASATKAPIAKIADKVSGVFVPTVILIAVITVIIWLLVGSSFPFALGRGISVLVISCPCALGLATPVAIMVGNGKGARNGILFKNATCLEEVGKTTIVALDKTGTITCGEPNVTDIIAVNGYSEEDLLKLACALEKKSEHPLSKAIIKKAQEEQIEADEVTDFTAVAGNGLTAVKNGEKLIGGSLRFVGSQIEISKEIKDKADIFSESGKTPLLFGAAGKCAGIIAVADIIKSDSAQAIKELKNMGIHVVMLTGDNEKTASAIGLQAGVDEVIADVLPADKEKVISRLKEQGKVAMVGDGINDAPALTRADTGIAIGNGSDIAIDAAEVVLMKNTLKDVAGAIRLSRATLRNIHQNLFWAFFYNVIGIPLAAGAWIHLFGWQLNPMFAAAAMSLSSFCVITNALRLNFYKLYDGRHDKKIKIKNMKRRSYETSSEEKEKNDMKKTMKIEGMMCAHCEGRVKKALEALPQVEEAIVSHEAGTAIVTMSEEVGNDVLKQAVEAQDYKVTSVE
jgi:Cu2+-exporting ATPase